MLLKNNINNMIFTDQEFLMYIKLQHYLYMLSINIIVLNLKSNYACEVEKEGNEYYIDKNNTRNGSEFLIYKA